MVQHYFLRVMSSTQTRLSTGVTAMTSVPAEFAAVVMKKQAALQAGFKQHEIQAELKEL